MDTNNYLPKQSQKSFQGYSQKVISEAKPVKVLVTNRFWDQVKHLCLSIYEVEWSGVLVYTYEGSIQDYENMKIMLLDIIPMNKGSKSYTSFSFNSNNDRMVDYFMENPERLDTKIKTGLIHSHNTMSVFFSGTDLDELKSNAANHNYYLSVIVNNKLDITGKIGMVTVFKPEGLKAIDEQGNPYLIQSEEEFSIFRTIPCEFFFEEKPDYMVAIEKSTKEVIEESKKVLPSVKTDSEWPYMPYLENPQSKDRSLKTTKKILDLIKNYIKGLTEILKEPAAKKIKNLLKTNFYASPEAFLNSFYKEMKTTEGVSAMVDSVAEFLIEESLDLELKYHFLNKVWTDALDRLTGEEDDDFPHLI